MTGDATSNLAQTDKSDEVKPKIVQTNLNNLKNELDNLDISKLKTIFVDLKKFAILYIIM